MLCGTVHRKGGRALTDKHRVQWIGNVVFQNPSATNALGKNVIALRRISNRVGTTTCAVCNVLAVQSIEQGKREEEV